MDENIVNFIGGYATAIKEEIIKVSPPCCNRRKYFK